MNDVKVLPRCNAHQMNRGLLLLSCRNAVQYCIDEIPERVDAAGIRQQLEMVCGILEGCSDRIIATFPEEKQDAMQHLREKLCIELTSKYTTPGVGFTQCRTDIFDTLVQYAHENCKLCVNTHKCNTCKLGKALDKCTPEERGKGESWADIWV